jgi:hypothetical protein
LQSVESELKEKKAEEKKLKKFAEDLTRSKHWPPDEAFVLARYKSVSDRLSGLDREVGKDYE